MAIQHYWYTGQLRNYLLQFCSVFHGLNVVTGKGEDGTKMAIPVPIVVGNRDRVVAAIQAGNTQNKPFSIPTMSAFMQGIDLAPERRKGVGTRDRKVFLPKGGIFPDDLKTNYRLMPIPYNINIELSLYASNTDQMYQMLEQLLLLFDPVLQIQISDATFDWTKITQIELTGLSNEENYPLSVDKRIIVWTFNFTMPVYLSAPMDIKDEIVREINVRLGNMDGFAPQLQEVDAEGELQPFSEVWGPIVNITF
jgi:hypothetical protein